MRFLNTRTGRFEEKDPTKTVYAILSHTWDNIEQTHKDIQEIQRSYDESGRLSRSSSPAQVADRVLHKGQDVGWAVVRLTSVASAYELFRAGVRRFMNAHRKQSPSLTPRRVAPASTPSIWHDPRFSAKVRQACTIARENGYDFLWIDSCCIDKTSSSELSEAINSMYEWYRGATVCYAYLADVPFDENHHAVSSSFRTSRWYDRGWTLQELIAPSALTFLSKDWKVIGTKGSLCDLVEAVTGIPEEALLHTKPLHAFSVAERFSWAAERQTMREEDRAYSLLGIFGIHMPTLYGEGELAFQRLQEEIVRRIPDQTLFAWPSVFLNIRLG